MKKTAEIKMDKKTAFHLFIYFILFSKLYRKGMIKEAIFKKKYNDIILLYIQISGLKFKPKANTLLCHFDEDEITKSNILNFKIF